MADMMTPRIPERPLLWPDAFLDLADWLVTLKIPLYIVGGAVRDAYMHRPIHDIDFALAGDAIGLARQVTNHYRGDIFVMDKERGVARVTIELWGETLTLDFAQFRGDDLFADLRYRDFTINAMAVPIDKLDTLIDPLGGEGDIRAKRLRRCGEQSIADDPLRTLRAIRQSAQLGFRIDPETLADVKSFAPQLGEVSNERVRDELFKLLTLKNPVGALRAGMAIGVLSPILPELVPLVGLAQSPPHVYDAWQHTLSVIEKMTRILEAIGPGRTDHTAANFDMGMLIIQLDRFRGLLYAHLQQVWPDKRPHNALLLLAILLHNVGKPLQNHPQDDDIALASPLVKARAAALRLSRGEVDYLATLVGHYRDFFNIQDYEPLTLHRFWFPLQAMGVDVCLMAMADYLGMRGTYLEQNKWLELVERVTILLDAFFNHYDTIVNPSLVVDGHVLMTELHLESGPLIKTLLTLIREAQVTGQVKTAEEAIECARRYLHMQQL